MNSVVWEGIQQSIEPSALVRASAVPSGSARTDVKPTSRFIEMLLPCRAGMIFNEFSMRVAA